MRRKAVNKYLVLASGILILHWEWGPEICMFHKLPGDSEVESRHSALKDSLL